MEKELLMIAILCVRVVVYPAGFIIDNMCNHNAKHSKRQKEQLVMVPELFGKQQQDPCHEQQDGGKRMMMSLVTMPKGDDSNNEGKHDHQVLKAYIIDELHSKEW